MMKRKSFALTLTVALVFLCAVATAATAGDIPRPAHPVWIELNGAVYQVGTTIQERTLHYLVLDRDGRPAVPADERRRQLAVLYEMTRSGYLRAEKRDEIRVLRQEIGAFEALHYGVSFFSRLQEELVNLGVVGTGVFFTGGTVVFNKLGNMVMDELIDAAVEAPQTAARNWCRVVLADSRSRVDRLLTEVERSSREGWGETRQRPMPAQWIQRAYADAVYVDIYAMPSSQLLMDLQPAADTVSQVRRLLGVAAGSAGDTLLPPAKQQALKSLIRAGKVLQGLEQGVPELAAYRAEVAQRTAHWEGSRGGLGETLKAAPVYADAAFYQPAAGQPARAVVAAARFRVTADRYTINDDLEGVCRRQFGRQYRLADWTDITRAFGAGVAPDDILAEGHAYVTHNGRKFWQGRRHFIASRNNHKPHSGYLSHANLDNHLFDLGSWHSDYLVLCTLRD